MQPERPTEPALNVPAAVLLPIAAMLAIHVGRNALPPDASTLVAFSLAFSPARLTGSAPFEAMAEDDLAPAVVGLVTYPFVHASFGGLALDALFLVVFGTMVARRFGAFRFAVLGLAATSAGAATYLAVLPQEVVPLLGAGALVGGYAGAAARFAFPDELPTAVFRLPTEAVWRMRAQTLAETLASPRAFAFIALYLLPKLALLALGGTATPALVGGVLVPAVAFVVGLVLFGPIDPVREPTRVTISRRDRGE